jgi:hypothetical protein
MKAPRKDFDQMIHRTWKPGILPWTVSDSEGNLLLSARETMLTDRCGHARELTSDETTRLVCRVVAEHNFIMSKIAEKRKRGDP